MTAELLAVYAGLALLAGLLISGRADWRLRLVAIVVVPLLAFALWRAAQPPKGWPTTNHQPVTASFLWGDIREPAAGDPGRIFIWLDVGASQPRAFSLPYTRQLHKQVQAAMNATKHGHTIAVSRMHGHGGQRSASLHFYPHPPVQLPRKEGQ